MTKKKKKNSSSLMNKGLKENKIKGGAVGFLERNEDFLSYI